jgi:hypothetical protein
MIALVLSTLVASHGGGGGDGGTNLVTGVVVIGLFATAAWVIFSELGFRATVGIAAGGWAAATFLFVA